MHKDTTADQYTPEEAQHRRDEVVKRMLNTPPKPHKEQKKKTGKKPKNKA